jgi:hypothetical protein
MSLRARAIAVVVIVAAGGVLSMVSRASSLGAASPGAPLPGRSAPIPPGFVDGAPGLQSAGALAFGPEGVLFVGDSRGSAVYALSVDDGSPDAHRGDVEIDNMDKRIAKLLSMAPDQVVIRDMAVNPATRHLFFSVSRGRGVDAAPAIVRATQAGELTLVPLARARYARLPLTDVPAETAKTPWGASSRAMAITDLAYSNGELLIAGLSNEAFASTLRRAKFPFSAGARATTLEIFHTSHGKYETAAPIETFLPYTVKGQPALLAGYGCAPLAVFDMAALGREKHVRGRTLAELGGGNRPNDMVGVEYNGKRSVIISNSDRTLMRMAAADIDRSEPLLTEASPEHPILGTPYVALPVIGVMQLDVLGPEYIVMLVRDIDDGSIKVRTYPVKYL